MGRAWRALWARSQALFGQPARGADRLALLGLALVALRFANWSWLSARIPGEAAFLANFAIQVLAFLAFCLLVAVGCRSPLPAWVVRLRPGRLLALAPVAFLVLLLAVSLSVANSLSSGRLLIDDANAMAVCGARAISNGHDPYQVSEIDCLRRLGLPVTLATPLRVGTLARVQGYPTAAEIEAAVRAAEARGDTGSLVPGLGKPPLDPVAMIPVARAPASVRALWTLLGLVVLAALLAWAAGRLWAGALSLLLLSYFIPGSALNFASFGNAESFAYVLMALAVLWIRRPLLSGIALGLALGSNELAAFFAPAYALMALRLPGRLARVAGALLALLVAVVPWLVRYPDALGKALANLTAPDFPLGYGPIELALGHVVPTPPAALMEGMALLAMVLILVWGWRRPAWRVAAGVLMLSGFWLSWRSLDEYMAQIPLLALAALVGLLLNADRDPSGAGGRAEGIPSVPPGPALPTGAGQA